MHNRTPAHAGAYETSTTHRRHRIIAGTGSSAESAGPEGIFRTRIGPRALTLLVGDRCAVMRARWNSVAPLRGTVARVGNWRRQQCRRALEVDVLIDQPTQRIC